NYGTFGLAANSFFPGGGIGFTFDGGLNELFEGGLIAGTDRNHISDGLHNAAGEPDGDFGVLSGGDMAITEPGNSATQQTQVAFSDSRAEYPLGLDIVQESYAWSAYPDDDFIILRYVITNSNAYDLFSVLFGLYLDWDVVEFQRNAGGYQTDEGYAWMAYNNPSSGDLQDFCGATVVDGPVASMLTQRGELTYYQGSLAPDGDGFTEQEKASSLAAGIANADVYKNGSLDLFQLIAAGPLSLPAGGTDTVAFAILAGNTLAEMSDAAARAMDAYEALGKPSTITVTEDLPDPIGLGETGSVSVSVLSEPDSVVLCYRQGGKSTYDRQAMIGTGQSYTGAVPGSSVTLRGVDYYVVAYSGGDSVTVPLFGGPNELIPFRARAAFADVTGPALANGAYQMVSFPFEVIPDDLSAVLEDDLGPPDRAVWRLGRWNQTRAAYDEYEQVGPLEPGRGYWLVVSGDKTIDADGRSTEPDVIVDGKEYWELPLQPGWNQIANPFAFHVGWDDCVRDGGLEPVIHEYTGTGYELAYVLEPFHGYWLRNTAGGVRYLYIPFKEGQAPAASPIRAYSDCLWRISLRLETAGLHDTSNFCGAHGLASSGPDLFDLGEPPVMGHYASLSFVEESGSGTRRLLAGDFRDTERERWEFQLLVRGNSGESARLSMGETFGLRDSMTLRISNESGSLDHDLRESGEVLLPEPLSEAGIILKLTVGCADCGGHSGSGNIPLSPALHPNYPNPFNPSTTISFDLPRGSKYTLTIYNVMGQKVDDFTGHARAGAVEIEWDATGKASGIYLYKLTSSGFSATRKMLLLK
ncbi:MAG: T9SS type A sorting domain-containing protein, partial [candidate division Zixibacteria bacterium]|nr:T9SS type A sorting domain-containing protein [candidate division Zixibacteria bacterium]